MEGASRHLETITTFMHLLVVQVRVFGQKFGVYLMMIDNVDIKYKTCSARLMLVLEWTDTFLAWNKSNFNNISKISIEAKSIWLPDLVIGNDEVIFKFIEADHMKDAVVYSDGTVNIWPYINVDISMKLNMFKYPFDTQIIKFQLYSWIHNDQEIDIHDIGMDRTITLKDVKQIYNDNGEWELVNIERRRYLQTYEDYGENYTIIEYKYIIRRKWLYTVLHVIAPIVLTSMLNPVSFLLPVDSEERISLVNTVFLAMAVFYATVNDSLPTTYEYIPIIVAYIGLQLVGSVLTIALAVWSLSLSHSKRKYNSRIWQLTSLLENQNERMDICSNTEQDKLVYLERSCQRYAKIGNSTYRTCRRATSNLDIICFWLSVIWNVALIVMVGIVANIE